MISNEHDPRVIRTRRLIQDAFLDISKNKSFSSITVRDITEKATINRSTFYAHFQDKYELLNIIISEAFIAYVVERVPHDSKLTKETLHNLIISICDFHKGLNEQCKRDHPSIATQIEAQMQIELYDLISSMILNSATYSNEERKKIDLVATMVSSSIYGTSYQWFTKNKCSSSILLSDEIFLFITSGIKAILGENSLHNS